jgi:glycosyltransferase involved in cell wall biosynthesis
MLSLLRGGLERGWDQHVFNPFDRDPKESQLGVEVEGISGIGYSARSTSRLSELLGARRWLKAGLKCFEPDVVQVYLPHAAALIATIRDLRVPVVLSHQHGSYFRFRRKRLAERVDRWAGLQMDSVVACSDAVRDFLLSEYRYEPGFVTTIRNGWEGRPAPTSRTVQPEGVAFICVAHLRPEKDHETLLKAFTKVIETHPASVLRLAGDGPLRSELVSLVDLLGLGSRVEFHGATRDVWDLLGRADVFVLSSQAEPLGIAVLEAMASGLPVIATNVGGLPEIVRHGENGLLVPPTDPAALATAMIRLASSPKERLSMGKAGRETASTNTMSSTVDRYFSHYRERLGVD